MIKGTYLGPVTELERERVREKGREDCGRRDDSVKEILGYFKQLMD